MRWQDRANRVLKTATGFEVRRPAPTVEAPPPPPPPPPPRPRPGFGFKPRAAEGKAVASNFFDDYPRFYETSETTPQRGRLNLRYEAIFGENRDIFAGARVLDIASHDGRWSLAALKTGAREVIGIEAKESLVAHAEDTLAHYGVNAEQYRFLTGDVFDVLERETFEVDVVLCLGFLYHTLRYNELLRHVRDLNPRHVMIDTAVTQSPKPYVFVRTEAHEYESNAVSDRYSHGDRVLVGRPSVPAMRRMMRAYDFELERLSDWPALLRDNPDANGVKVYRERKRTTARFRAVT